VPAKLLVATVVLVSALALVGCDAPALVGHSRSAERYIERTVRDLHDIDDATRASGTAHQLYPECVRVLPDHTFLRTFDDGTWVMGRTASYHAPGVGYDATVFLDSKGDSYFQTDYHICDASELGSMMGAEAGDLAGFYEAFGPRPGLTLKRW